MSVNLTINSVDKTDIVKWDSLTREENLSKEPSKLYFYISNSTSQTYKPTVGDEVILTINSIKEFAGYVVEIREGIVGLKENVQIVCKDYTHELDRQLVSKTYENDTVNDIIADLLTTFSTGFTDNNVNCDIVIDKVVFNYLPISKCLEKLTDLVAEFEWYCDYNKDIHFFYSTAGSPSIFLTDTSNNYIFGSLNTHEDTHQLRNEIIIRGGLLTSDTAREELLSGDGTKTIFPLATKFASKPVIEVGGSPVTVGIANIDQTGFDVYWDYNEKSLEFAVPPASGSNNISVEQVYEYPLILQKRSEESILEYGLFQYVIVDKNIKDLETASLRADAEIIRYAIPAKTASFRTRLQGIKAGQILNIQSNIRNTNDNYKINMIRSRIISPVDDTLEHTVEAITAEDLGINDILALLLIKNPSDQIQISQGEVVSRIRQLQDSLDITDVTPTVSSIFTSRYTWGADPDEMTWNFGSWDYVYKYDNGELYDFAVWEL